MTKNLRIFYNTVIKQIHKDSSGRRITTIDAIQRIHTETGNRCRFLSEELPDWYSYNDSQWFNKTKLSFTNLSYVIEGSSWGEVLVLSNASFLQGIMEEFDGDVSGNGNWSCGQMFTIDFLEQLRDKPTDEPPNPLPEPAGGGEYSLLGRPWERAWTYRRVNQRSTGRGFTPPRPVPSRPAADLSRNFQRRGGGGASSNLAVSPSFDNIIFFR